MDEDDTASLSAFNGGHPSRTLTSRESFEATTNPAGAGTRSLKRHPTGLAPAASRVLETDREGDFSEGSAGRE
jgi:hypothetical protein